MHCDLPDGVVNATSSPSCFAVPSRVAEWNWFTSAGRPDSMNLITSPTSAPASGALAGVGVDVGVVVRGVEMSSWSGPTGAPSARRLGQPL